MSTSGSSSTHSGNQPWLAIWNTHIPPKIKVFVWRVAHDALHSLRNLKKRKITLDTCCKRCGEEEESTDHALFWCPSVEEVWVLAGVWDLLKLRKGLSTLDLIGWIQMKSSAGEFERFCIVLWSIWNARNSIYHNKVYMAAGKLVDWSDDFLLEFQGGSVKALGRGSGDAQQKLQVWEAPSVGLLKMNTDAAVRDGNDAIGLGVIIRDNYGRVAAALSKCVRASSQWKLLKCWLLEKGYF